MQQEMVHPTTMPNNDQPTFSFNLSNHSSKISRGTNFSQKTLIIQWDQLRNDSRSHLAASSPDFRAVEHILSVSDLPGTAQTEKGRVKWCGVALHAISFGMQRSPKQYTHSTPGNWNLHRHSRPKWDNCGGIGLLLLWRCTQSNVSWNCLLQAKGTFQSQSAPWGSCGPLFECRVHPATQTRANRLAKV